MLRISTLSRGVAAFLLAGLPLDAPAADALSAYPASDYTEQARGVPGGTLHLTVETDTATLDFHSISHGNVQWLGRFLFDNLTYLDAAGKPSPWLATSWEISPDGLIYTFHLRHDVTFSDGTPFDAYAVRDNLEHMRDPRTKSPLAAAYIAPYAGGRIVDPYTFEARLREPYAPFRNVLAQSWLSMVSPRQIRAHPERIATQPVGSGPFILESYTRQRGLRFVRRADYHWAPAVLNHDGPAYLERVELDIVPEALSRYLSLVSGQYDATLDAPRQSIAALRRDPRFAFVSRIRTGLPMMALTFNLDKSPFDDPLVRRALAKAVDRAGLAHSVFFDVDLPSTVFLARDTRFYDPRWNGVLAYDPAEANRLLDRASWTRRDAQGYRVKEGRRLGADLLVVDTPLSAQVAVAVQDNFKSVGFALSIVKLPPAQYILRRYNGNYQALGAGYWHTNTPDVLYIQFDSAEIASPKRIGQNVVHLRDPELDSLLAEARRSSDSAELARLYSLAQGRLVEDVPAVPIAESQTAFAYNKRLHGVLYDTSHNTPVFTAAWLERAP